MKRRIFLKQASTMAVALALPQASRAQADWPTKAIHIVVPVAPGGSIGDYFASSTGGRP